MSLNRLRRVALGLVGCGLVAFIAPAVSQANFEAPYNVQCSGGKTAGAGTKLQAHVATLWDRGFHGGSSSLACKGGGASELEFFTQSTPEALGAIGSIAGVRDPLYRVANTEEPPTLSQWLNIDLGDKPGEDSGLIRQIPVASTAIVPIVKFPSGCTIPAKEATADGRFIVSNAQLEKAFAGKIATWGELLPDIEAPCAAKPIKRVVPAGSEGSTFVFKQWLAKVDPALGWEESSSLANNAWPNDSGATATERSEGGEEDEAETVIRTDGSIGLASLPVARALEFGYFSPENPDYSGGGLFWLSVENGSGVRTEPTRDKLSGTDNVRGANCDNPTFNYTPSGYDTTVAPVWRAVSAAGSKTGWPICTLTYDLAWDDASTVYGKTAEVEAGQRTVKDFLAYVLGPVGQMEAKEQDYSSLPAAFLADATDGQSRVGWNKTAGSKSNSIQSQIKSAAQHTAA
jgi:ABC-type phosphate transport system substrate-binding protein